MRLPSIKCTEAELAEIQAAAGDEPLGPWIVEAAVERARLQEIRERLLAGFGPLGYALSVLGKHCAAHPSKEAREAYDALAELAKLWSGK
jgi:hypothetical protein